MLRSAALPRTLRAPLVQARGLATVADPPVRHYGGLKDQDRGFCVWEAADCLGIFTNLLSKGVYKVGGGASEMEV